MKKLGSKLFWIVIVIYTIAVAVISNKAEFIINTTLMEQGKLDPREQLEFQVAQYAESTEIQIVKTIGEDYLVIDDPSYYFDFINFEELYSNGIQNGDVVQFTLKGDKQGDVITSKVIIQYGYRNVVDYYSENDNQIVTTEPCGILKILLTSDSISGIEKLRFIQSRINTGDTDYTVYCKVLGQISRLEENIVGEPREIISDNTPKESEDTNEIKTDK